MTKKVVEKVAQNEILSEPKVIEVKQYIVTLSKFDNGEEKITENNIGFSFLELLGLLVKLVKAKT